MRLPQLSLIAAVLSSVALAAHALPMNSATVSFERFVVSFNKTYASPIERESRLGVFQQNLNRIATHPIGSSYSLGITAFADLTTADALADVISSVFYLFFFVVTSSVSLALCVAIKCRLPYFGMHRPCEESRYTGTGCKERGV